MNKLLTILASIFLMVACEQKSENNIGARIRVTTTTTILKDLIENIGGDKISVQNLMGEGVDPHLYKASAGDISKLSNTDLVIFGGLHLEGKMGKIFEKLKNQNKVVLNVGDSIDKDKLIMADQHTPDPHVWFDTNLWLQEANAISETLSKIDEQNTEFYKNNLQSYKLEIEKLTAYSQEQLNLIPKERRVLITAHDAFTYFARQFDLEVKAIQGISTDAQAGTKDISELAEFIATHKIKAIFTENSVPKRTIEALQEAVQARGAVVKIGGELYSDSLGDKKHNAETYIKTFKANVDTIVRALK